METIDIILFSGQSNMQGQAETLPCREPVPGAYEYKFCSDGIVPLRDPVGEDILRDKSAGRRIDKGTPLGEWLEAHLTGSAVYGNATLVPAFCEEYIRQTDRRVLAVHIAKGSTEIAYWLPGADGFDILVEKASAAIKKAAEEAPVGHIFFVWLQGESDAIAGRSKAYYKQKLYLLQSALKERLSVEKFGMIRVGRFTNDDRDLEILAAQDEVCSENGDFLMLTRIAAELNKDPCYMSAQARGHYNEKGLERLGSAAGEELGRFCAGRG